MDSREEHAWEEKTGLLGMMALDLHQQQCTCVSNPTNHFICLAIFPAASVNEMGPTNPCVEKKVQTRSQLYCSNHNKNIITRFHYKLDHIFYLVTGLAFSAMHLIVFALNSLGSGCAMVLER